MGFNGKCVPDGLLIGCEIGDQWLDEAWTPNGSTVRAAGGGELGGAAE